MNSKDFLAFIFSISEGPLLVLDSAIPNTKYVSLDLSKNNKELDKVNVTSVLELGNYINELIKKHNGLVAYGGYKEERIIYKRSSHFSNENEERNMHLGIDLWSEAETPIFTPLDATVHSFKNNTNFGDYGPTIILQHTIKKVIFYTLYGHLSLKSIGCLEVGQTFKQGEQIATLGDGAVNGNYPPHLHFQIIKDLQGKNGDYPGVSSKKDLDFYTKNCPDPNMLLKLY